MSPREGVEAALMVQVQKFDLRLLTEKNKPQLGRPPCPQPPSVIHWLDDGEEIKRQSAELQHRGQQRYHSTSELSLSSQSLSQFCLGFHRIQLQTLRLAHKQGANGLGEDAQISSQHCS